MAGALFDTNILIDYLSRVEAAREELKRYRSRSISVITWIEVMAGLPPQHEDKTRAFLTTFVSLPITTAVAEQAVILQRERRINCRLPSSWQLRRWASALSRET